MAVFYLSYYSFYQHLAYGRMSRPFGRRVEEIHPIPYWILAISSRACFMRRYIASDASE